MNVFYRTIGDKPDPVFIDPDTMCFVNNLNLPPWFSHWIYDYLDLPEENPSVQDVQKYERENLSNGLYQCLIEPLETYENSLQRTRGLIVTEVFTYALVPVYMSAKSKSSWSQRLYRFTFLEK